MPTRIGIDMRNDRRGSAWSGGGGIRGPGRRIRSCSRGNVWTVGRGGPNVAIAFENLFGGNFGTVVEKGRII